ncbi:MAG: hypothetical protein QW304_05005 [Thermoproteota archaeon]
MLWTAFLRLVWLSNGDHVMEIGHRLKYLAINGMLARILGSGESNRLLGDHIFLLVGRG